MAICLVCGLLGGCEEEQADGTPTRTFDVELVNTLNNIEVENAIITQHTLYPYHFVTDGEELNELGQRDLMVLARHFKEHPGVLNIRQGDGTPASCTSAAVAQRAEPVERGRRGPGPHEHLRRDARAAPACLRSAS